MVQVALFACLAAAEVLRAAGAAEDEDLAPDRHGRVAGPLLADAVAVRGRDEPRVLLRVVPQERKVCPGPRRSRSSMLFGEIPAFSLCYSVLSCRSIVRKSILFSNVVLVFLVPSGCH